MRFYIKEVCMPTAVRISDNLVKKAKSRAKTFKRSISGQIEFWAKIGEIAEDNPDLSYSFIKNILIGQEEIISEQVSEYKFGEGK